MLAGGFGPFILLATISDPVAAACAMASGLMARKWWHLIPASLSAPAAYLLFRSAVASDSHFETLLPFLLAAGAIWSGAALAARRAWRS
jgi:hypothetical protein